VGPAAAAAAPDEIIYTCSSPSLEMESERSSHHGDRLRYYVQVLRIFVFKRETRDDRVYVLQYITYIAYSMCRASLSRCPLSLAFSSCIFDVFRKRFWKKVYHCRIIIYNNIVHHIIIIIYFIYQKQEYVYNYINQLL